MWHAYFCKILRDSFSEIQVSEGSTSLRSYAKRLKISAGLLSELLREQRRISTERALQIAKLLPISAELSQRLQEAIQADGEGGRKLVIPEDAFESVLNPLYYRFITALELFPVPAPLAAVRNFLKMSEESFATMLASLERLQVVQVKDEEIFWQGKNVETSADIPSQQIQNFHRKVLTEVCDSLSLGVAEREFTVINFVGDEGQMTEAKEKIRSFRDFFPQSMLSVKNNRVYQLSIQLVPVSERLDEERAK